MFAVRLLFKLPRVVPQQKDKFEEEDIFKKHSRETEVKYTLYRDRPGPERQAKFQSGCRDGHTEIVSIYILRQHKYLIRCKRSGEDFQK